MPLTLPPDAPDAPPPTPSRLQDPDTFSANHDNALAWLFGQMYAGFAAFRLWYANTAAVELAALQDDVTGKQGTATDAATAAVAAAAAAVPAAATATAQAAIAVAKAAQTTADAEATAADRVAVDEALQSAGVPAAASQAEAEAGAEAALRSFSPLRIKQAIEALTPSTPAPARHVYTASAPTGTWSRGASQASTYTKTTAGGTVGVTFAGHGRAVGDRVFCDFTSGTATDGWATVTAVADANNYTLSNPTTTGTGPGNVTIHQPIVITMTSQATHGLSNADVTYVDWNATFTDSLCTVYKSAAGSFQVQPVLTASATLGSGGAGTASLPNVSQILEWAKPAGLVAALITAAGAGAPGGSALGSGGGPSTGSTGASGGGSTKLVLAAALGATETMTLGGMGINASDTAANSSLSVAGKTTSFGAHLSATGASGSTPGVGVGGDVNARGNATGASLLSGAAAPASTNSNGNDGTYGAGGSGGHDNTEVTRTYGGRGGPGTIIVEELF